MRIYDNVGQVIGNTPLVRLNRVTEGCGAAVIGKLELMNPCHSVKDRIGHAMIEDAERRGLLSKDSVVIEPTSGNTGIGLAAVCAMKGYRLITVMAENMSIERRKIIGAFGAEIVLTPKEKGTLGAVEKAEALAAQMENSFMPYQFKNPANPDIHRKTTAEEIWRDTGGTVDIFVAGVGTGGTITGVSEVLKKYNPKLKTVAVEPEASPVLSGGKPGPHLIQGTGAGFIPDVLNRDIIDEIVQVSDQDAFAMTRQIIRREGILCGISAGAAVHAAVTIAKREENNGKTVVAILPDTGERYLSTDLFKEQG
ncbi:MAG: cysteine synthase A [bacterium]|nr:cysteine synthase A [bacterium]